MLGGFLKTVPKTPAEFITAGLQTPAPVPVGGGAAVVFKSITKTAGSKLGGALLAGGAAGLIGASLLGGSKQEQQQELTQQARVDPRQRIEELQARAKAQIETLLTKAKQQQEQIIKPVVQPTGPIYTISGIGGGVEIGGTTQVTKTITTTYAGQSVDVSPILGAISRASAEQIAALEQYAGQEQEATQLGGGLMIALVAIAAIALLGGK